MSIREVVGPENAAMMDEIAKDPQAYLNTPHIPEDAGEYAEGLARVLARIPEGWGRWISCDKGWYPLIVETDENLAALDASYEVNQVKEKFGGLRYYHQLVTEGSDYEAGWAVEREAERRSYTICEICGATGVCRNDHGWLKTLCDEHGGDQPIQNWEPVSG